ncbi:MAG TPA: YggT family protein [Pyrinomonadaceae bacterium]|nr:YggT family protein [Pyrinomonadaceae bacterium]
MLILERLYWFVNWALITSIVALIVLLVLRLIANQLDLNPFTWSSRTIRRLTDPIIGPVRRTITAAGVDQKFAPLITILLLLLLGLVALQVVAGIANTLAGVVMGIGAQALGPAIGYLLHGLLSFYSLLIFIRIILSWGRVSYSNRLVRLLTSVTEPLLGPLRRVVPRVGMFDISPIVALIIVWLCQAVVARALLRGMRLDFFA